MTSRRERTPRTVSRRERLEANVLRAGLRLPPRVKRALAGPPVEIDGDVLDIDFALGRKAMARSRADLATTHIDLSRRQMLVSARAIAGPPARLESVTDLEIPTRAGSVAARLYRPRESTRTAGRSLPLLVHFHGGGWALGDLESHGPVCAALASRSEVAVLSVDYRRPPEHVFPAALEDCLDAFRWAREHAPDLGCDPERVAVGGDSAGGNLAAVVSQVCRDDGTPGPAYQLLLVPAVDALASTGSRQTFDAGYLLTGTDINWYLDTYLGGHDRADPRVSPLRASSFEGLPPAYVGVASFDPLRDEGIAYAEALRSAGIPVTLKVVPGAVHQVFSVLATKLGREALIDAADHLRSALATPR